MNLYIFLFTDTYPWLSISYKEKTVEKFDTLIVDKNLEISITKSYSDSFVTNEFENEGKKQVDKYRDAEISLKIKQDNK